VNPFIKQVFGVEHLSLDGLGEVPVVSEHAELHVAVLSARAGHQQEPVINREELGVVADVAAVEFLGTQDGSGPEVFRHLGGIGAEWLGCSLRLAAE